MVLANSTLVEASERALGKKHEPKFCKSGWRIAIETPHDVIGLWSCWLDNQFYLGHPKWASFELQKQALEQTKLHCVTSDAEPFVLLKYIFYFVTTCSQIKKCGTTALCLSYYDRPLSWSLAISVKASLMFCSLSINPGRVYH